MSVARSPVVRHLRLPVCRVVLVMTLGAAVIGIVPGSPPASAAPADVPRTDSAVTKSGKPGGPFANLKVTVSQTKSLINQTVTVSWTGGVPTFPTYTNFGLHFMQIMQCWSDDPGGPDRAQCQYGGLRVGTANSGSWVRTRQVTYPWVDPKETIKKPAGGTQNVYVPFWPAGRSQPTGPAFTDANDFFDRQVTNEIPVARTRGDGTGLEFFEVQTIRQAAGLGCGAPVTTGGVTTGGVITGRSCWLVVVPRGNIEVDGSVRTGSPTTSDSDNLASSPLSASNWEHRIVVPLEFLPVGQPCPIGAPERQVIGHELAVDAVSRWQPKLCADGGALYSYTQLGDDVARELVLDGRSPGLALVTNPIPTERAPPDRPLVYAPMGLSALVIAFNVEHQPGLGAPDAARQLDGIRFPSMKLTPRLVAKLLTQSYRRAVAGLPEYLKNNPIGLTVDPEFLDINPEYRNFATFYQAPDVMVQLGSSDLTSQLWSWVKADPEASAFLAGEPDKFGMVINSHNKDLTLPTSSFPRNDQTCEELNFFGVKAKQCTLDSHPYANDMHEAGVSASRGDSLAYEVDGSGVVLGTGRTAMKKRDRQVSGRRALLAVVDAATASRYNLPTAALRNAAGQFALPTTTGLLAAAAAMKPSAVAGVLAPDVSAADPAAYPLTALSYAVTSPSILDAAAGKDYAALVRYAAGPGQQPGAAAGQLPFGMAPLPDALRAQSAAAAATIEAQAGKTVATPAPPPPPSVAETGSRVGGAAGSTGTPSAAAQTGGGSTTSGGGTGKPPTGVTRVAVQGAGSDAEAPGRTQQPAAGLRLTPATAIAGVGGLLLALLISGVLAAGLAPVARRLGTRKPATTRKEVVATKP